jgi:hypothetical protein
MPADRLIGPPHDHAITAGQQLPIQQTPRQRRPHTNQVLLDATQLCPLSNLSAGAQGQIVSVAADAVCYNRCCKRSNKPRGQSNSTS